MKTVKAFINKKHTPLGYKVTAAAVCLYGLIISSGIHRGQFLPFMLFYYTNICNILCLICFTLSALRRDNVRFKGACLVAVTVLVITYWTMLFPNDEFSLFNLLLHLVIPLLLIFDWVLFDKKGRFSKIDPVIWLAVPLSYYIYAMVIAQFDYVFYTGTRFVYFFLDYETLGAGIAAICFAGIMLAALLIGYVYVFISNKMAKNRDVKKHVKF